MPGHDQESGRDNFDPRYWSLRDWKQVDKVYMIVDTLVSQRPCFLFAILCTGYDDDKGIVKVYDAHNAGSGLTLNIRTATGVSFYQHYFPPMFFSRGLFVDLVDKMDAVTVHYLPLPVM